jgi:hypothetical protein
VASLEARSQLRGAHPLLFVNKLVSLIALTVFIVVGWVAVSFLKSDTFDRWRTGSSDAVPGSKSATALVQESASTDVKPMITPVRLVYSWANDKNYYHVSTHLPVRCERTAMSEEAAGKKGLKRCRVCFPE